MTEKSENTTKKADNNNSGNAGKTEKSDKTNKIKDRSAKRDKMKPLTKIIIRRLPPTMTEEDFLKQIEPLPDHDNYYYVAADWSLGHDATCRAYITFKNAEEIFLFKDRFDGYVFVDNKGAEYPAIVEYAPFQGLPRNKSRKRDPKSNSIETDPHYMSFLEALQNEENETKNELKLEFSLSLKDDKKITSTPLLQYLANKKQERRDERKRKLDEKKRQREEERQRKKTQILKNVPPPIKEEEAKESAKDGGKRTEKGKDKDRNDDTARKEARSKKRAERDFKRRQEREKRLQERKAAEQKEHKTSGSEINAEKEGGNNSSKSNDSKKKEVKKYSESRRSRTDFKRSHDSLSENDKNKSNSVENESKNNPPKTADKETKNSPAEKQEEVSENVKEFFKSVAGCKDLNSKTELEVAPKKACSSKSSKEVNMSEVSEKLEKICLNEKNKMRFSESSSTTRLDRNERIREERLARRIRNKDRPSLEIYQPGKLRMKKEESGRSSAELKDYKSSPTSDCESTNKDRGDEREQQETTIRKKVSRYSERRSERAREKQLLKEENAIGDTIGDTIENVSVNRQPSIECPAEEKTFDELE